MNYLIFRILSKCVHVSRIRHPWSVLCTRRSWAREKFRVDRILFEQDCLNIEWRPLGEIVSTQDRIKTFRVRRRTFYTLYPLAYEKVGGGARAPLRFKSFFVNTKLFYNSLIWINCIRFSGFDSKGGLTEKEKKIKSAFVFLFILTIFFPRFSFSSLWNTYHHGFFFRGLILFRTVFFFYLWILSKTRAF